jgi:hypothetical protein
MKMRIPLVYSVVHYTLGFMSNKYWALIPLFVCYQLLQLALGVRFFFADHRCLVQLNRCHASGNSLYHTMFKINQFVAGYVVGYVVKRMYLKRLSLEQKRVEDTETM